MLKSTARCSIKCLAEHSIYRRCLNSFTVNQNAEFASCGKKGLMLELHNGETDTCFVEILPFHGYGESVMRYDSFCISRRDNNVSETLSLFIVIISLIKRVSNYDY